MKQKLLALRALAERQQAKIAAGSLMVLASAAARADTVDVGTVLDTLIGGIMTGIGTTFAKVTPLMALVFGVAFAWRWVKKGSKS